MGLIIFTVGAGIFLVLLCLSRSSVGMKIAGFALFALWTVFLGLFWLGQQFMEHFGDVYECGDLTPGCKGAPDSYLWQYSVIWGLGLALIGWATFRKPRQKSGE